MFRTAALLVVLILPAAATAFERISDRATFVSLVNGAQLTRLGITLRVTPGGDITGRAFGQDVSGDWSWNGGYFCRDLYYGDSALGANCQTVEVRGATMRFTADRGAGQSANLTLKR